MIKALALSATLIALSAPAVAQDTPPVAQTADDWNTTEVVIKGKFPGPALWRVKKGESEVYIMGAMPVMTKHAEWDMGRIGRILDKANVFLTNPEAKSGAISLVKWQFAKSTGPFTSLYQLLTPEQSMRFRRVVHDNGLDPNTYMHDSPVYAAMHLREDVYEKRGISTNDPEKMMVFLARYRKTPMRPMAKYSASKMLDKLDGMGKSARIDCVVDTLNEIDFTLKHVKAATAAWSVGDLATAHANSPNSATWACLEGAGSTKDLLDNAVNDAVGAIDTALQKPGKSVIVFPLSVLLRKDGALARLRAEGAEVSEPEI